MYVDLGRAALNKSLLYELVSVVCQKMAFAYTVCLPILCMLVSGGQL